MQPSIKEKQTQREAGKTCYPICISHTESMMSGKERKDLCLLEEKTWMEIHECFELGGPSNATQKEKKQK